MKTRILLTIGDINGIGPEIILKILNNSNFISQYDLTVVAPIHALEYYSGLYNLKINVSNIKRIEIEGNHVKVQPGKISKMSGLIAGFAIQTAVELCLKRKYDAIVTAPISKKALNLAGFNYNGHTEMLAVLSKVKQVVMIMVHNKISIGFASTHPPLKNVTGILGKNLLVDKISICYDSIINDFGINKPRIAVLSLNPHSGEGGQIGDEEIKIIKPAMNFLKKKLKALLDGPFPSDSYFANKTYNKYHLTFAMYHDQGMIPFKMVAGAFGVNYTAGLSFVRTSPDHGTAFDIAGKNLASEVSLIAAIKAADRIFKNRLKKKTKNKYI
jgi:4-hydroxythreonine-4-phosphate dehydrogenase